MIDDRQKKKNPQLFCKKSIYPFLLYKFMFIPLSAAEIRKCINCKHDFKVFTKLDKQRKWWCKKECEIEYKTVVKLEKAEKKNYKPPKVLTFRIANCIVCNQEMPDKRVKTSICSPECRIQMHKNKTIGQLKSSNKSGHYSIIVRKFNRLWNNSLTKTPCLKCGYSLHVELAHIRPVSLFPDTATLGEVNAKANIMPLCPNCHWEFDSLSKPAKDWFLVKLKKA